MDINTFYAIVSATCCTLEGLWWSVVRGKTEWYEDEVTRQVVLFNKRISQIVMDLSAKAAGRFRCYMELS